MSLDFIVMLPVWREDDPDALRSALRSVFDNSLRPREVLVCQDGPLTDPLEAILREYPIRRHLNPGRRGLHHNLNAALCVVDAEWIARADADDVNTPNRFAVQAAILQSDARIDVLGSDIFEISPDGRTTRKSMPTDHAQIASMARFRSPINHNSAFIRTRALKAVGGYPDLPRREDYGLWMKMIAEGYRFANVPAPLVRMTLGDDFLRRRSAGSFRAELDLGALRSAMPNISRPLALIVTIARAAVLAAGPVLIKPVYGLLRRRAAFRKQQQAPVHLPRAHRKS